MFIQVTIVYMVVKTKDGFYIINDFILLAVIKYGIMRTCFIVSFTRKCRYRKLGWQNPLHPREWGSNKIRDLFIP